MGFYQPAQLIGDAIKHGVAIKPVDINFSVWDNKMEEKSGKYYIIRLGFRQVKGLRQEDTAILIANRNGPYTSINALRDIALPEGALDKLADADAFRSIGLDRRQALWEVFTKDRPVAMFTGQPAADAAVENIQLPIMSASEHVIQDYAATAFSLKAHPVSFVREKLDQLRITATHQLATLKNGAFVKVAGLVLVRQRPGTAKGICFMTIEDETGFANLVIFEKLFDEFRKEILQSKLIMVEGNVQIEGEVIHVIVKRCYDFSKLLRQLTASKTDNPQVLTLAYADEKSVPAHAQNNKQKLKAEEEENVFYGGRNFK